MRHDVAMVSVSGGQPQDVQKGRQGPSEGPWQPQNAEQQKEFMRNKLAQRQQQTQVRRTMHVQLQRLRIGIAVRDQNRCSCG